MTNTFLSSVLSILPTSVVSAMGDRAYFEERALKYRAYTDEELVGLARCCLKNVGRLDLDRPLFDCADSYLRSFLLPELCERIQRGVRCELRRLHTSVVERDPERSCRPRRPNTSIFRLAFSADQLRRMDDDARDARAQVDKLESMDAASLVEQVRFAVSGVRSCDRFSASDSVYEPALVYLVTPVVAVRVLERMAR